MTDPLVGRVVPRAPGERWRHYKGRVYVVLQIACLEADKRLLVIYQASSEGDLSLGDGVTYGVVWARPIEDWVATVGGRQRFEPAE